MSDVPKSDDFGNLWDESEAKDIIKRCLSATSEISEIVKMAERFDSKEKKRAVRKATAEAAAAIYTDIMMPIIDIYPHLAPDYLEK